jgi:hypothetical protein
MPDAKGTASMNSGRIAELSRAPDWRAALLILTSDMFKHDGRVWQHVDLSGSGSIHFEKMLDDGTFSGGERRLLKIAASLFSQRQQINLWATLNGLDEKNTALALRAIHTFCEDDS